MWEEMAFELERNGDRKNNESCKGNIYSSVWNNDFTTNQYANRKPHLSFSETAFPVL